MLISLDGAHIFVFSAQVSNENAIFMDFGVGRAPAPFFRISIDFELWRPSGAVFVGFHAKSSEFR